MSDDVFVGLGGGENWDQSYAGAGPVDTAVQIVKSIDDGDWLAAGGNAITAGLDLLSVIDNPLDVIGTSALGWFIEHVGFLNAFLDNTVGDPVAIDNAAATLTAAAVKLDKLAGEQFTAFTKEIPIYRNGASPSKATFEERIGPRAEELKLLSVQCEGLGRSLIAAGMWVATIRGVMRDLLAEFAWWGLQKISIALAAMFHSGGASVGVALGDFIRGGVQLSGTLTSKLAECSESLAKLMAKVQRLTELMGTPVRTAATAGLQNLLPSGGKAIDDTAQSYQPSAYDEARKKAESDPPPGMETRGPVSPPAEPFGPVQVRGSAWRAEGTLDGP